jgi:hypothetical protein
MDKDTRLINSFALSQKIIHTIISWFLKKRLHQMQLFLTNPLEVQNDILMRLIATNHSCKFGKQHQFKQINDYHSFIKNIPLQNYESLAQYIDRMRNGEQHILITEKVKWFAKSSGTSNAKSKFIPITKSALEDNHYKAVKDLLAVYLNNNPQAKMFEGKGLRLGGSSELYKESDTSFGDLSAIIIENLPIWADLKSTPKQKTALLAEWESKMEHIIAETIPENVTNLAGVPSWMLVLIKKILIDNKKENLLEIWPNLEVYFHGGVSFKPYKAQFKKLIPKANFKYYEIYNASEGFFAFQDQNNSDELLLLLDYGIFYEFIPMDNYNGLQSNTIPLEEVILDKNYALVITTNSGLWRYVVGDTVAFTSLNPYRIKVTGRTQHYINTFGEELIMDNAEKALAKTCKNFDAIVQEYTLAPVFMADNTKGKHQWLIEFVQKPKDINAFTKALDNALQNLNSDYEAKRYKDITLENLVITIAKNGLFYKWLEKHQKIGGQHKIARLQNDRILIDELLEMNM